ncbi:MAG: DNA adenine methylase [Eubacterium sp.]|nr:DNA adenine methylase [Eubacterium sp.]
MKTFIKYPGGKANELEIIEKNKPENIKRYFEPFVGGGSVYFDFEIKRSYINDKSEDLIILYKYIKNKNEEFIRLVKDVNDAWKSLDTKNNNFRFDFIRCNEDLDEIYRHYKLADDERKKKRIDILIEEGEIEEAYDNTITSAKAAFYYTMRYLYNKKINELITAVTYYFMREYCFSSMFRFSPSGDFNVPYGGKSYNHKNMDSKIELIESYDMSKTVIHNEDFQKFMNRYKFNKNDFIFVDPPYDSEFSNYDGNEFNKNEQIRLADYLSKTNAKIMIIVKNTDFIYKLYNKLGFNIQIFDKTYSVSFRNRNKRKVEHLIITNY